jgi:hypothetical protein
MSEDRNPVRGHFHRLRLAEALVIPTFSADVGSLRLRPLYSWTELR